MKRSVALLVLACAAVSLAQEEPAASPTATPTPEPLPTLEPKAAPPKRGFFGRMLHPFSSNNSAPPVYKDPKLRGLTLDLEISPQPVKLSEIRQLEIKLTVTNRSKRAVTLDFVNDQRIDIHLMNSAEVVLTRWSDNHVIEPKPGVVLINPQEKVEYNQTIATRDLSPNKVFVADVFFPKYPELRVRQKFLTAP
jgi:Intracellular proteinase inhibitor